MSWSLTDCWFCIGNIPIRWFEVNNVLVPLCKKCYEKNRYEENLTHNIREVDKEEMIMRIALQ